MQKIQAGQFYEVKEFSLRKLAELTGAKYHDARENNASMYERSHAIAGQVSQPELTAENLNSDIIIRSVAPLDRANLSDVTFLENTSYLEQVPHTRASACFIAEKFASRLPKHVVALITPEPYRAFARAASLLYPEALRPQAIYAEESHIHPAAFVHPSARLEAGVTIDPGVVIGAGVEIGSNTIIGANVVIGPHVKIGRDCAISTGATLVNSLLGNRVILHSGVRIGQDGFGFAMGPRGHLKVPQVGRVIIQDDVEIGANTTIDRGANRDTIIGEGTKIDNLVQIGHNVVVGRHCVIVSQVGISGSTTLEDYVVVGGQVGIVGHANIGMGAQIAAKSGVVGDVPAGARFAGAPAKNARQVFREVHALAKLAAKEPVNKDA